MSRRLIASVLGIMLVVPVSANQTNFVCCWEIQEPFDS